MPFCMPCQDTTVQSKFKLSASQLFVFLFFAFLIAQNQKRIGKQGKGAINIRLGDRVLKTTAQSEGEGGNEWYIYIYIYKEWTGVGKEKQHSNRSLIQQKFAA